MPNEQPQEETNMTEYTVTIKANVEVTVESESADSITADMVEAALVEQQGDARYLTIKNGVHFDHEEFEVLG